VTATPEPIDACPADPLLLVLQSFLPKSLLLKELAE
jgi:hypothetical protein